MWLAQGLNRFSTSKTLDTALVHQSDPMSKAIMAHKFMLLESNGFQIKLNSDDKLFQVVKEDGETLTGIKAVKYVFDKAGCSKSEEELQSLIADSNTRHDMVDDD